MFRIKICFAQNDGKVWISGEKSFRPHFGPIFPWAEHITNVICWPFLLSTSGGAIGSMITGSGDSSQLGGPIRIAKISGQVAEFGILPFISLMAYISISLGLINLFPIPMLDGGHLMFYGIEKILGRPLSQKTQERFFRIGMFLLLSLMFFTTFNDLKDVGLF